MNNKNTIIIITIFFILFFTISISSVFAYTINKTYNNDFITFDSWWDNSAKPNSALKGKQKILFHYYGANASCKNLTAEEEKICRSKHPFWNPGTFQLAGNLIIKGASLLFNRADSSGVHWIMTGIYEPLYNAIGFDKNNPDLIFGRDIYIEKNLEMNNDTENTLFLNNADTTKINQTDNNLFLFNNSNKEIELFNSTQTMNNIPYKIKINNGLEINNYTKTNEIYFKQGLLKYCTKTSCSNPNRKHEDNFIFKQ